MLDFDVNMEQLHKYPQNVSTYKNKPIISVCLSIYQSICQIIWHWNCNMQLKTITTFFGESDSDFLKFSLFSENFSSWENKKKMITISIIGSLTKGDGDILHKRSRGIHYVGKIVFRTTQKHLQYDWRLLRRTDTYSLEPNKKNLKQLLHLGFKML